MQVTRTRHPSARGAVVVAAALIASSCGRDRGVLTVRVSSTDGSPVAGVEITVVPFDLFALLDSLTDAAPTPRPDFSEMERELAGYRPDTAVAARSRIDEPWEALRDSAMALSDSLFDMDRGDSDYPPAYERFRALYRQLTQESAARDRALRELGADDLALARQAQAAADSLRRWESIAFADYEALAADELARVGHQPVVARSDTDGIAVFELPAGQWWFHARQTDPDNPFMEFRWQGTARLTSWLPFRVPLGPGNVEHVWRH